MGNFKVESPFTAHQNLQKEQEKLKLKQEQEQEKKKQKEKEQQEQDKLKKQQDQEKLKKEDLQKAEQQKKADKLRALDDQKRDDKLRADNLRRMTGQIAGAVNNKISGSGGSGDAVKSTGNNRADPGYGDKIKVKIKSNAVYFASDNLPGNPSVEFLIELLPDGSLRGTPKKTKSSGVPAFDDAILRAITKTVPFPPDKTGVVPASLELVYKMKD